MEEHRLKVYYAWNRNSQIPRINLQGKWLERMGFSIGDRLKVECQDGRIVITKENEPTAGN